jgi:hypothetical protein
MNEILIKGNGCLYSEQSNDSYIIINQNYIEIKNIDYFFKKEYCIDIKIMRDLMYDLIYKYRIFINHFNLNDYISDTENQNALNLSWRFAELIIEQFTLIKSSSFTKIYHFKI